MTRAEELRATLRYRIVLATRISLSSGDSLDERLIADVGERVGVHPHGIRTLFPANGALILAVNDMLVDECASRLRTRLDRFLPETEEGKFQDASRVLAESAPLDRGSIVIRSERRLGALKNPGNGEAVVAAERRFLDELTPIFVELMSKLDRVFVWPPILAVRVILTTYERSFEAWILRGHSETDFPRSPYVERTLPRLLKEVSDKLGSYVPSVENDELDFLISEARDEKIA